MEERIRQAFESFLDRNRAKVEAKASLVGSGKDLHFTIAGKTHIIPAAIAQVENKNTSTLY